MQGLMAHVDCKKFTDAAVLDSLPPFEQMGPRHQPIPHARFNEAILRCTEDHGNKLIKAEYALSGPDTNFAKFFARYVFDSTRRDGMGDTLIFGRSNGQHMANRMAGGANTFACDNGAFCGDIELMHRKSTSGFNLLEEIEESIRLWLVNQELFDVKIEKAKNRLVSETQAKALLLDVFSNNCLPKRLMRPTVDAYFNPEEDATEIHENHGRLWGVVEACTRVARDLPLSSRIDRTQKTVAGLLSSADLN